MVDMEVMVDTAAMVVMDMVDGGYGYGGYGTGYGYGGYGSGYGSKYHKRSTDHQQVHVSGYAGQPTVVPTNAYGGYSSYAPAYYGGHHASSYAPGYGYSSYAPSSYAPSSHSSYAPYSYSSYNYAPYGYSHGSRYPYAAGSSSYAPSHSSYAAPAHSSYAPSHSSYAAPTHSSYAPGHSSYAPGHQTHGYGNVKYSAGTPFMYSRAPGYGPQGV